MRERGISFFIVCFWEWGFFLFGLKKDTFSGWWNKTKKGMEIHKKLCVFSLMLKTGNGFYREKFKREKRELILPLLLETCVDNIMESKISSEKYALLIWIDC